MINILWKFYYIPFIGVWWIAGKYGSSSLITEVKYTKGDNPWTQIRIYSHLPGNLKKITFFKMYDYIAFKSF